MSEQLKEDMDQQTSDKINQAIMTAAAALATDSMGSVPGKPWYTSKTLWVNGITAVAIGLQMRYGYVASPDVQLLALAGVNMLLRKLTGEPIVW